MSDSFFPGREVGSWKSRQVAVAEEQRAVFAEQLAEDELARQVFGVAQADPRSLQVAFERLAAAGVRLFAVLVRQTHHAGISPQLEVALNFLHVFLQRRADVEAVLVVWDDRWVAFGERLCFELSVDGRERVDGSHSV